MGGWFVPNLLKFISPNSLTQTASVKRCIRFSPSVGSIQWQEDIVASFGFGFGFGFGFHFRFPLAFTFALANMISIGTAMVLRGIRQGIIISVAG